MQIDSQLIDQSVLDELGRRLARTRLERNLSQAQFAEESGLGRRTVQRLESGEPVELVSFIRALRVLGLLPGLNELVPEPTPSPLERLKLQGRPRQRAAGRRAAPGPERTPEELWEWGDEAPS